VSNQPKNHWTHTSTYPTGRCFGEILDWHITYWGTRSGCSLTNREDNQPWKIWLFSEAIHIGVNSDKALKNTIRKLENWRFDKHPVGRCGQFNKIIESLFGDDENLSLWRGDLIQAHERRKGKYTSATVENIDDEATIALESTSDEPTIHGRKQKRGNPVGSSKSGVDRSNSGDHNHIGADARAGVAVIADKLAVHFYGRDSDLETISTFVNERMESGGSGLLIITAPAGFGKSALAVHWCRETGNIPGRHIASHLCSVLSPEATTKHDNIFANLRRQIVEAYGDATDKFDHKDAVVNLLATAPPDDRQLVVWLDGIDEADDLIHCFLPEKLGDRVCAIVSARADAQVTPAYVDEWQNSPRAELHQPRRYDVSKLPLQDVEKMVHGMLGAAEVSPPSDLHRRIFHASEQGYALFARMMVEDAIDALKKDKKIDFGEVPESLAGYAASQLRRLRELKASWKDYQPLFAFLTVAREAVDIDELPALIGRSILFEEIPERISRWFILMDGDNKSRALLLSFAHPKLKQVFGEALGSQHVGAERELCKRLLREEREDWPPYAWRHLPRHLAASGHLDKAADILMNLDFIAARFDALGAIETPSLLAADWMAWYSATKKRGAQV